ncbi:hydroperoxy fatty acid reductase [Acinetobacter phage AbP2]|uniref:Hydroperoxy fatty acid reductase n=1 Tax=Acinetobacter phage AbP2 TaxID=2015804 RepID=A0A220NQI2_9CAUD|nr:hydroperoxy fatty acid reductase [Acinetobacter phage AbP2]ASJ78896.1 hydroperoxy fatty acid reductase [Acinetobacter phage AbP2]
MNYILNKCLVENEVGDIVWSSTKPNDPLVKMQSKISCDSKYSKEFFDKFSLNHEDSFKIVIYLKNENKARLAQNEVAWAISKFSNILEDGYCVIDQSIHKTN